MAYTFQIPSFPLKKFNQINQYADEENSVPKFSTAECFSSSHDYI